MEIKLVAQEDTDAEVSRKGRRDNKQVKAGKTGRLMLKKQYKLFI